MERADLEARIALLTQFRNDVDFMAFSGGMDTAEEQLFAARQRMARALVAVRQAVLATGAPIHYTAAGLAGPADLIANAMTISCSDEPIMRDVGALVDCIEAAIGVYEHVRDGTGLVSFGQQPQAIDIEGAIVRALRPAFGSVHPDDEKAVQDEVETILRALGVRYTREQDRQVTGIKSYIPDFALDDVSLALEVKLAARTKTASQVQEEMAADMTGYRPRWQRILFVIYDVNAAIIDEARFRAENMRQQGVSVLVVKH